MVWRWSYNISKVYCTGIGKYGIIWSSQSTQKPHSLNLPHQPKLPLTLCPVRLVAASPDDSVIWVRHHARRSQFISYNQTTLSHTERNMCWSANYKVRLWRHWWNRLCACYSVLRDGWPWILGGNRDAANIMRLERGLLDPGNPCG